MIEIVMEVDDEFWNILNQLKEFKGQKEIIHCKDCKHGIPDRGDEEIMGYECDRHYDSYWDADDFCSWGKKKDDEN